MLHLAEEGRSVAMGAELEGTVVCRLHMSNPRKIENERIGSRITSAWIAGLRRRGSEASKSFGVWILVSLASNPTIAPMRQHPSVLIPAGGVMAVVGTNKASAILRGDLLVWSS